MRRIHMAGFSTVLSLLFLGCDDGANDAIDQGVGAGGMAVASSDAMGSMMPSDLSDGGRTGGDVGTPVDAGLVDAAPSGPDCLEIQDCDAVCAWFVECSIIECDDYDRTSSEPLDALCRGACEALADVLCNHRYCSETIAYIRGLDPNGEYANACADAVPDPESP